MDKEQTKTECEGLQTLIIDTENGYYELNGRDISESGEELVLCFRHGNRRDGRTDDSKKEELEQVIMKLINEIVKQPLPEQSITILPAMVRELIRLWEI